MLSTLSTSFSGMAAAAQQFAVSAANVAATGAAGLSARQTSGTPTVEVRQVRTNSTSVSDNDAAGASDTAASSALDPVQELLQMLEAHQSYAASARSGNTVAEVFRSLYGNLQD